MIPSSIMHLVLCTLTFCFFLGSHALPVVFPSLNTFGFAKIENKDQLVSIPAAFAHLLCKTTGESVEFSMASKSCSRMVFFTANNALTLYFLNLSSNGVVQPLSVTPQIRSSEEKLDLSWTIPNLRYGANRSRTEGTQTSVKKANCGHLSGTDAVEAAHNISGFLDPSCTVSSNFSFVVALHLERLPEHKFITLEFGFEDNVTRSLRIYVDTSPVSVDIKPKEMLKGDPNGGSVYHEVNVTFSARLVSGPNENNFSCPNVTQPLTLLIGAAQFLNGRHALTAYHLLAVVNASDATSKCPKPLKELRNTSFVRLNNVDANFTIEETGLDICQRTNGGSPWKTVVKTNISIGESHARNISVEINGDKFISLFGMPVPRTNKTINLTSGPDTSLTGTGTDASTSKSDSVAVMKKLGTTLSGLTGAAVGLSFVVSLGMPFLSFVAPAGGPDLMSELGCLSSVVDLMHIGQRTYLLTKLKVTNLPESFTAFGEQFSWTMLNFKAPWDKKSRSDNTAGTSDSSRRKLLSNDASSKDGDSKEDPYSKLRDTYFWTGIALVSLGFLHCVLLVIFIRYRNNVPSILRLPRLELYLIQSCIAIVAQGPAYLFSGSTRQIIIGVLVLTVGIIPLAFWHYRVIRKYLFDEGREEKRIVYTLNSVDLSDHVNGAVHTSETPNGTTTEPLIARVSVRSLPRENIQNEGDQSWFSKHIVSLLFGPLYRSGRWTFRDGQAVRVIDRFGPVFEDYRGKPMYENHAQQGNAGEMNDESRKFEPVQPEHRYPIDVPEYSFLLRISEKVISLGTMVFTTLLIMGEDDPGSNYQAALLLIVQVAYVAYLRAFRPHCSRWKLGVSMFEKTLDAISLFLVIWKLNIGHSTSRNDIGVVMAILEAIAIGMQLIDIVLTILPMIKKAREAFWSAESEERTPSLISLFMRHPNMEIGFEEMMFENPREAISLKIIQPLKTSLQSARRRRRPQSGTDSNHNRESVHNGSSCPNQAEAEQTNE